MKRRWILILALMTNVILSKSQVVKISNGVSFSKISFEEEKDIYSSPVLSHFINAGIAFINSDYYDISSELGYLTKGGRKNIEILGEQSKIADEIRTRINYLQINTVIRGKLPVSENVKLFLGVGPKVDFLLNSHSNINNQYIDDTPYDLNKLTLEFMGGYLHDMGKINKKYKSKNKTFLIGFSIGYKL